MEWIFHIDSLVKLSFHIDREERKRQCTAKGGAADPAKPPPASHKRQQTPLASIMAMHYQKKASVFY
ncbi:hypothetical protein [Mesorhizobium sp. J8]|uniref:hypothetical protein n=1 Tax=Mesorhizobium sp. J8 TaxID=2777475 RepID=UPI0019162C83|nr:hypothetical protein [Mesorhizobium sp. J8]